jgi:uncharacterized iron-regulated protein
LVLKLILSAVFLIISAKAQAHNQLYIGSNAQPTTLEEALKNIKPGTVLVVGELHDNVAHHNNQVSILNELAKTNNKISVGMEFFETPNQSDVNDFLSGKTIESTFLKTIGWGGGDFNLYKKQVLFPTKHNGTTLALNAPRSLTSRISKVGIQGLTVGEQKLIPPGFQLGNANYNERFKAVMGNHVPAAAIQRYFEAQSMWDDTMAYTASEFITKNPDQILMIIVGDFHVQYGGGLPDRLQQRGMNVQTISQTNSAGLEEVTLKEVLLPDPVHGQRGDFIWIAD